MCIPVCRCAKNQRDIELISAEGKAAKEAFSGIKPGVNFFANFGKASISVLDGKGGMALPSSQNSKPALQYK